LGLRGIYGQGSSLVRWFTTETRKTRKKCTLRALY
jgi:hypothetical protein